MAVWLFARGDVAAGGAGDESPLIISDKSLTVEATHHFTFNRGGRGAVRAAPQRPPPPAGPAQDLPQCGGSESGGDRQTGGGLAQSDHRVPAGGARRRCPTAAAAAVAGPGAPTTCPLPLRAVVSRGDRGEARLRHNRWTAPRSGPDDFASRAFDVLEVPVPQGIGGFEFQVDADMGADRDQVYRIVITDREDGRSRGIPVRGLLGDPASAGYRNIQGRRPGTGRADAAERLR